MKHASLPRPPWGPLVPGLLLLPLALLPVACSSGDDSGGGDTTTVDGVEARLRRERAAVHLDQDSLDKARAELAPLLDQGDARLSDFVGAIVVELRAGLTEPAADLLRRARARFPEAPALDYLEARLAQGRGDLAGEIASLRRVHAALPQDRATRFCLAQALAALAFETDDEADYAALHEEARALYTGLEQDGLAHGGIWYVSAIYGLLQQARELGEDEQAQGYSDTWKALSEGLGAAAASEAEKLSAGPAAYRAPAPDGNSLAEGPVPPSYAPAGSLLPELAGATLLQLHDLDGDRRMDVVASTPSGTWVALQDRDGGFAATRVREQPADQLLAIDLNRDDDWDLVWVQGARWGLLEHDEGVWIPSPVTLPDLPSAVLDALPVDLDHDGDLDLVVVGDFGLRQFRNDGAAVPQPAKDAAPGDPLPPRGGFTDATAEMGLDLARPLRWVVSEDLDADQDVDLLAGGAQGVLLASSLRGGRFEDQAAARLAGARLPVRPLVADLDGDGRADVLAPGADATLWRQGADGRFSAMQLGLPLPDDVRLREVDLDLDCVPDVVWSAADAVLAGVLAPGLDERRAFSVGAAAGPGPLAVADLDSSNDPDLAFELLRGGPDGLTLHRSEGPVGHAVRLRYVGVKDNRQAIGALVEVRARDRYRRIYWRGDLELLGLGPATYADIVRVTWPNGVVGNDLGLERGDLTLLSESFGNQPEGLIGSCPFLYTWDGTTYTFVSDVLGITPLGLPMAPGMLVPPDHDEYVLVRGDQLVARDGVYELQVTEELREVTYLDHVRLEVVDHPAGTEVLPDERFTFPPFPEPHTHTLREPLAPVRATGSDGADWTAALARADDVHAEPFEPLGGQFLGLATPHFLELAFDPDALRDARRLRLVCTGWFYWTDASVNMASARTPGLDFVPPMISVPTPDGDWAPIGPPVGFPAGKTKSMVIDLTEHLDREDPRLRIGSTLTLYWDRIALAVDDDDAPLTVTTLPVVAAELWERGFSEPVPAPRADLPERFDWERLADRPRWDQHPGRYTRFGPCRELLDEVDDRFVILGSGDCVTLRFDATAVPPLAEGQVRDYLLFLDGWAKDRDPNTIEALEVEPLPFHGMSGYPYGPDERFPDGDTHRAWRATWNTRPARKAVVPLAPAAFDAWLAAGRTHGEPAADAPR